MPDDKTISVPTYPSMPIYTVDVPEVKDFKAEFIYNFFVTDETINDSGVLSEETKDLMNITGVIFTKSQNGTLNESDLRKIPRFIKLSFTKPSGDGIRYGTINDVGISGINDFLSNIVNEDNFSGDHYTSINTDNENIKEQTVGIFKQDYSTVVQQLQTNFDDKNPQILNSVIAASSFSVQKKGADFTQGLVNSNFENLKKVKFVGQINNNVIYDLFLYASGSYEPNHEIYANNLEFAKSKIKTNPKFTISDKDFKPTITVYQDGSEGSLKTASINGSEGSSNKASLIGYLIEKVELFSDGKIKVHNPILLNKGTTNSYVDLKVRYGAIYSYKVKSLFKITYPAIDDDLKPTTVDSIISSKAEKTYVEATESLSPPAPIELKFVWDYDRFNPTTSKVDPVSGLPFPGTGTRGSLMAYWSFPINPQLDIKKFQLFRRKTVNDPFELIKMVDFDDSAIQFPALEEFINPSLVQRSIIERLNKPSISVPIQSYYDDEFLKNSDYIYAVACIDAHGWTSNYSEQFRVTFDPYANKLVTKLVSIAGAPKQYPNMYLEEDLFLDTIKISNKKNLYVYLTPDCLTVKKTDQSKIDILNSSKNGSEYVINFINTDKGEGRKLEINIDDLTKQL
jgi:hypothetical protein